jgi:hypothetical protein
MEQTSKIPSGWHAQSHRFWMQGQRAEAIQATINQLNTLGQEKPPPLVLQLTYYLFLIGDYQSAVRVLEHQVATSPGDPQALLNLAVCCSRLPRHADAIRHAEAVLAVEPENVVAWDVLAKSRFALGSRAQAVAAGTQALVLKDRRCRGAAENWSLPAENPRTYARAPGKRDVIAFSLWGTKQRYLRGAIQNILRAREHFPGWALRFYVDDSLPPEMTRLIVELGAEVIAQPAAQSQRQKLCWRFQVANDPQVGHFMVRDVDSVLGAREARAVDAWLASRAWFHIIRDWWTHTDLILAGMWGGVAGVLPSLSSMLLSYDPGKVETPNVDQWFLGDEVWPYVRQSCLVHDRCFRAPDAVALPGPEPADGEHIGQDEFAVRRQEQEGCLKPLIERYPRLRAVLAFE